MRLIERDIVSEALGRGEQWDPHVFDALAPYLTDDVLDIGANVGGLTLRFAERAKRVIAFEPNERMYECLVANTVGLPVVCINEGCYSREAFIQPDVTSYPPSSWTWIPQGDGTRAAPARWPEMGRRVSAIKSDIQGADLHALIGIESVILRDRPVIVFEYDANLSRPHGHTWDDYLARMGGWGYRVSQVKEGHEDYLAVPA